MLIIKLGGSLIQNSLTEINPKIFSLVKKLQDTNIQAVISPGGGKITRLFQNVMKDQGVTDDMALDWVGIRTLAVNSEYIKALFDPNRVYPKIFDSEEVLADAVKEKRSYDFFVGSAWEPGHSSDYVAVSLAIQFGSDKVIRMSDVDSVYDSDPKNNPAAIKIDKVSWDDYLKIIDTKKWTPGASFPVDPIAARLAKKHGIKFYFVTLEKFLEMDEFTLEDFGGTVIF